MSGVGAGVTPPYPRVLPCRHCGLVTLRDIDGSWIHASLSYTCRDRWGGVAGTTAEPAAPPPPHTQRRASSCRRGQSLPSVMSLPAPSAVSWLSAVPFDDPLYGTVDLAEP